MAGELKGMLNKAMDAAGGVAGKMGASMTTTADGFVANAAIGDRYEVEAGRIARRRSRNEQVRHLAQHMIADHTTSTHHLQAALEMNETRGVSAAPTELDARRRGMIQHLEEAPEEDFDRTYLDQQVLAHQETVSLMTSYRDGGDNPQLRSLAAATAPVVERHLTMVEAARAAL